jgi:hypothetical protein
MSSKVTATCYGSPPWLQALAIRMVASPVEDLEYEFIDGEEELYSDVNSARTAFTNTVLSPPDVVGVGGSRHSGGWGLTMCGRWSEAATSSSSRGTPLR